MSTTMRISPDGLRMIHHDDYCPAGAIPRRASTVEPIQSGPHAGKWAVDMSPLGTKFEYCLITPSDTRREALAAEVAHLKEVWIIGQSNSAN